MSARRAGAALAVPVALAAALSACSSPPPGPPAARHAAAAAGPVPRPPGVTAARVCGQPALDSPFSYAGAPGRYASGTAGLPTYGRPGTDFPAATAGMILPAGRHSYASFQLSPDTVYYLVPGVHVGSFQADANDAFVGGRAGGTPAVLSGDYSGVAQAIDSNYSDGNQPGVTIEYLTIEKFQPPGDGAAINQSTNTGWTIRDSTITLNAPGAGAIAGSDGTLAGDCMTLNGQYGFQSSDTGTWGQDKITQGPYDVTVTGNEISFNDTCDFEGLLTNKVIGWSKHNPVPARYRDPHCGSVTGDGNEGGFKLWHTDGVTISGNYIHDNWGPGIWADTDNANTRYTGNAITANDGPAIIEEISYNFSVTGNYLADNGWPEGLDNPGFPTPAIYVSQSGSDSRFGGVPACPEPGCARQAAYPAQSAISGNTFVNNAGSVLLWQNSDRFCSAGFDSACTLAGGPAAKFTMPGCKANLRTAALNPAGSAGTASGSPSQDWWDGCLWWTSNVKVTGNVIDFRPAALPHCDPAAWPDCGGGGIFAEYSVAAPYNRPGGWALLSEVTFFQGDTFAGNVYNGPSTFYAWNQGNGNNPVSWDSWTGRVSAGTRCSTDTDRRSGTCGGPFGQDAGSTYHRRPVATPPPLGLTG